MDQLNLVIYLDELQYYTEHALPEDIKKYKERILNSLKRGAAATGCYDWRCTGEKPGIVDGSIILTFKKSPGSHEETLLTHKMNRLLEIEEEEK